MTYSNVHQMVCDDLLVNDHENHRSVDRCSRSEEGLSRPSPQSRHGKRVEQAWLGGEGTTPCTGTGEGGKRPGQVSTQSPCRAVAGILKHIAQHPPLPNPPQLSPVARAVPVPTRVRASLGKPQSVGGCPSRDSGRDKRCQHGIKTWSDMRPCRPSFTKLPWGPRWASSRKALTACGQLCRRVRRL